MVRDVEKLTQTKWNFWGSAFCSKQGLLNWSRDIRYYEKTGFRLLRDRKKARKKPDPETGISAKLGDV